MVFVINIVALVNQHDGSNLLTSLLIMRSHIRRELKIADAPTKRAADSIFDGAPPLRRELKIADAPTKQVADSTFDGAPAA